jgi:hypothetical protein
VTWRFTPQQDDHDNNNNNNNNTNNNNNDNDLQELAAAQQRAWCSSSDWLGLFRVDNNNNAENANETTVVDGDVLQQPLSNHNYLQALYMTGEIAW